jgi:hypothetical protein
LWAKIASLIPILIKLRTALFFVSKHQVVVIFCRRFATTYRYHFQGYQESETVSSYIHSFKSLNIHRMKERQDSFRQLITYFVEVTFNVSFFNSFLLRRHSYIWRQVSSMYLVLQRQGCVWYKCHINLELMKQEKGLKLEGCESESGLIFCVSVSASCTTNLRASFLYGMSPRRFS